MLVTYFIGFLVKAFNCWLHSTCTIMYFNFFFTPPSLAKSQHYSDGLIEIFTQYGDHLYR